tara:strand:- start:24 stop:224 length:201 start_codon:yes stop_codon:yes gene_type:complete
MSDPKIDPERMEKWKANTLPVPSVELLKGKGSSPSSSASRVVNGFPRLSSLDHSQSSYMGGLGAKI